MPLGKFAGLKTTTTNSKPRSQVNVDLIPDVSERVALCVGRVSGGVCPCGGGVAWGGIPGSRGVSECVALGKNPEELLSCPKITSSLNVAPDTPPLVSESLFKSS